MDEENSQSGNIDKKIHDNSRFHQKTILLLGLVALVLIVAFKLIPQSFINFGNGEFKLKNCETCTNGTCKPEPNFESFKVFDSNVHVYAKTTQGMSRIINFPDSKEMKCAFAKHKNYMFDCQYENYSFENMMSSYSTAAIGFDGDSKFIWRSSSKFANQKNETTLSCDVR
jgi:hypothetical protein